MQRTVKAEMLKEAKRIEEAVRHSAQNQFEYSKTWRMVDRWLGGAAATLAAISGATGLAKVFDIKIVGLIALIAAAAGAVATSLGAPRTKTQAHASANAYLALQQDTRIFINIDLERLEVEEARDALAKLVARQQELNATSEIPSRLARKRAKANLNDDSQLYDVDKEA